MTNIYIYSLLADTARQQQSRDCLNENVWSLYPLATQYNNAFVLKDSLTMMVRRPTIQSYDARREEIKKGGDLVVGGGGTYRDTAGSR